MALGADKDTIRLVAYDNDVALEYKAQWRGGVSRDEYSRGQTDKVAFGNLEAGFPPPVIGLTMQLGYTALHRITGYLPAMIVLKIRGLTLWSTRERRLDKGEWDTRERRLVIRGQATEWDQNRETMSGRTISQLDLRTWATILLDRLGLRPPRQPVKTICSALKTGGGSTPSEISDIMVTRTTLNQPAV